MEEKETSEKRFDENFNNEKKIKSFVIYSVVQETKLHMEKFKYTGRSYSLFERWDLKFKISWTRMIGFNNTIKVSSKKGRRNALTTLQVENKELRNPETA